MPARVPVDIEDDDADIEMPEEMMPQRKEYLWGTDLEGNTNFF